MDWKKYQVGSLWDNGKTIRGSINIPENVERNEDGSTKVTILRNTFKKEGESTPDFRVYAGLPKLEGPKKEDEVVVEEEDEDIPF